MNKEMPQQTLTEMLLTKSAHNHQHLQRLIMGSNNVQKEEEKQSMPPPPEHSIPVARGRGRGRGRARGKNLSSSSSVIRSNTIPSADISQSAPLNDISLGFEDENFLRLIRGAFDDHSADDHSEEIIM